MMLEDEEFLRRVKAAAAKWNYHPDAFLAMAEAAAEWNNKAVVSELGPYPRAIDEATIEQEHLEVWPEWVAGWVPAGSKWERLHWGDGSVTMRLVDPRGRVIGAQFFAKDEKQDEAG